MGTDQDRRGPMGTYGDRSGKTGTGQDRPGQTRTDGDRPGQTGTDGDIRKQIRKDRDRPGQTETDGDRPGQVGTDGDSLVGAVTTVCCWACSTPPSWPGTASLSPPVGTYVLPLHFSVSLLLLRIEKMASLTH